MNMESLEAKAKVSISLMKAGSCLHPEFVVLKGGSWQNKSFPSTFAFIEHESFGRILFDCGYSKRFYEATRNFPFNIYAFVTPLSLETDELACKQLEKLGVQASSINWIFISHFHADHVGALRDFPQARFLFFASAFESVAKLKGLAALKAGFLSELLPSDFQARASLIESKTEIELPGCFAPFNRAYDLAGDKTLLAVSLPGHVSGHAGLIVRAGSQEARQDYFLVADACWSSKSFQELRMPNPITNLICADSALYKKTIHQLHELHKANPKIKIIPSHCSEAFSKECSQ